MESRNIALQGTLCTGGSAVGICVGLGDGTVFGRIAKQATTERPVRTTLESEILRFVLIIAGLALTVALFIVGVCEHPFSQNYRLLDRFTGSASLNSSLGCVAQSLPSRLYTRAGSFDRLCVGSRGFYSWCVIFGALFTFTSTD